MRKEKSSRESDINNKMEVIVERNSESIDRQTEKTRRDVNDFKTKFMQQKQLMI